MKILKLIQWILTMGLETLLQLMDAQVISGPYLGCLYAQLKMPFVNPLAFRGTDLSLDLH